MADRAIRTRRRAHSPRRSVSACFCAISVSRVMSTGRPAKCTGMMARVRGVIAASTAVQIEVDAVRLNVHDHGGRPRVNDHVDSGAERHGRCDDLVARPDPRRYQAEVEGRRAGVDRDAIWRTSVLPELILEPRDLRTGAEPCRSHARYDLVDLGILDLWCAEHQEAVTTPDGCTRCSNVGRSPWRDAIPRPDIADPPRSSPAR